MVDCSAFACEFIINNYGPHVVQQIWYFATYEVTNALPTNSPVKPDEDEPNVTDDG